MTTIDQQQSRVSGLTRDRMPGDPVLAKARAELGRLQQSAAGERILGAVEMRNNRLPAEEWVPQIKPPGVPLSIVVLEAVEMLAFFVRASDRPDELLAALRERVEAASG